MNTLLLVFFAIPIAVIIFSIALQRIFRCPILVASIIFAIFLVIAFAIGNLTVLILAIAYSLLALITAWLSCMAKRIFRRLLNNEGCGSSGCLNNENDNLATQSNINEVLQAINNLSINNNNCSCNRNNRYFCRRRF